MNDEKMLFIYNKTTPSKESQVLGKAECGGFSDNMLLSSKVGGLFLCYFKAKTFTLNKTNLAGLVLLPKSQTLWLNPHLPFIPLSCLFP